MLTVTKRFTFEASHYLPGHTKCGQIHGHSYKLEVTVQGPCQQDGMVVDFHDLKAVVEPVVDAMDHQCLNNVMPLTTPPTAEYILGWLTEGIEYNIAQCANWPSNAVLYQLRLWETEDSYATLVLDQGDFDG